jgi:hypothetical protein
VSLLVASLSWQSFSPLVQDCLAKGGNFTASIVRFGRGLSGEVVAGVKWNIQWHSSGPRHRAQSSARARRRDGRNGTAAAAETA